ncbi:hypothetical protein [Nitrospira japonica]|uniref:hypothetical protein n=1 Tax=Nitrospira japonica TaxID=1325564 RepID=UPI0012DBF44C|nr:hypothetical protein [Nitrospira japonica]
MAVILLRHDHSSSAVDLGCEACRPALPALAMLPKSTAIGMDLSSSRRIEHDRVSHWGIDRDRVGELDRRDIGE